MSSAKNGYIFKGRIIDGSLSEPIENGVLVSKGERIAWVGPADALPAQYRGEREADYEVVDLPGRSIMPGLIDGHIHISFGESRSEEENALYTPVEFRTLKAVWYAKKVLQAGVTSAFDAATSYNIAPSVRDAINSGMFDGPRMAVSGRQLTSHQGLEDSFPNGMQFPPGQSGVLIRQAAELVPEIRYQSKDGVDAIKVSGSNDANIGPSDMASCAFSYEEFKIIADETHRLGLFCSVHARSRESALLCAKAGFDNLFHASYIDDEGIDACLKSGSVITPTLTLLVNSLEAKKGSKGVVMNAMREEVDAAQVGLAKAYRAGVPLIAGSESGWSPVPYGHWHAREMEIFVDLLGMTPLEAIHSNTLAATKLLPKFGHEVGKLEAGRRADILVVPGNPLEDIRLLQRPASFDYIFKDGAPIDRTPPKSRERQWFERHKVFLDGLYEYDQEAQSGRLVR